jgi:hypothetical protein
MTIQEIIDAALTHLGVLPAGEATSAEDAEWGLQSFESMLTSLPSIARKLTRVRIDEAHTAEENTRIFNTTGSNLTITLPEEIDDPGHPEADDNDDRPPANGAVVGVSGATYGLYVYVELLGAWKAVTGLALTDDNPLGPEHDEGLGYMLAVRLAPSFGVTPNQIVLESAAAGRRLIRQRFRQDYAPAIDLTLLRTSAWRENAAGLTNTDT